MTTTPEQLQRIIEAAIMVAGRPLTVADLQKLFDESEQPDTKLVRETVQAIQASYAERGIELREVASGFQFQAKTEYSPWLSRLWEERAPRFTRAFLETVALIAYRQPITRAEIEEIRGVAVSSNIIKTLQEREWIRVIGHRDVPGKPALYGTTKTFLDHLNLKSLDQLPSLADIIDLEAQEEKLQIQLELGKQSEEDAEIENDVATSDSAETAIDTAATTDISASEEDTDSHAADDTEENTEATPYPHEADATENVSDPDTAVEISATADIEASAEDLYPQAADETDNASDAASETTS